MIKEIRFFKEREIEHKYFNDIVATLKLERLVKDQMVFERG